MAGSSTKNDVVSEQIGFEAMRRFLERYWEIGGRESEEIAILLSSINRVDGSSALPADAALWHDWIEAYAHAAKAYGNVD